VTVAWRHLRAAEAIGDTGEDALATAAFALVRSRLLGGRGELRGAVRALDTVQARRDGRAPPPWLDQEIGLANARLVVAMGRPAEALAVVEALDDGRSAQAAVVKAAALAACGDTGRAIELVIPVIEAPDPSTPLLIEAWLTLAVAASERGQAETVRTSLGNALTLAAPDVHRRAFHQAGPRLRQLMRGDADLAASYRSLGDSSAAKSHALPSVDATILVDALSQRELQVLRYLAAMLGTEEIAEAMYVSVNTVKTHVRSILRKLGASRRNEAVRRARGLGLV